MEWISVISKGFGTESAVYGLLTFMKLGAVILLKKDVYLADLDQCRAVSGIPYENYLSEDEKKRLSLITVSQSRNTMMLRRSLTRMIISSYLNCYPEKIRFYRNSYGKPSVIEPVTDLKFNLSHGAVPNYLIGYSMGLITALACSHAITFEEGAFLLYEINRKESKKEGMATIIGFEKDELVQIIKDSQCEDKVFIACENNPYCFGISGYENFIQSVCDLAAERGALNIYTIDSKFAFHTPLYHIPERDLSVSAAKIKVVDSAIPVVSAIDQSILWKADDLSEELIRNMYSTVKWGKLISSLAQSGTRHFIEAGLGKGLTKISRSMEDACRFDTFDTICRENVTTLI
nr:acyltransferase domain-containing protein [uncultured Clostridium sp.]